jgi:hypothetical protein
MKLAAAGNTLIPAFLTLKEMGYQVTRRTTGTDQAEIWIAAKDGNEFTADNPLELLGLVTMGETRGEEWLATDAETEEFLKHFNVE